jgi:hypothetical protein
MSPRLVLRRSRLASSAASVSSLDIAEVAECFRKELVGGPRLDDQNPIVSGCVRCCASPTRGVARVLAIEITGKRHRSIPLLDHVVRRPCGAPSGWRPSAPRRQSRPLPLVKAGLQPPTIQFRPPAGPRPIPTGSTTPWCRAGCTSPPAPAAAAGSWRPSSRSLRERVPERRSS